VKVISSLFSTPHSKSRLPLYLPHHTLCPIYFFPHFLFFIFIVFTLFYFNKNKWFPFFFTLPYSPFSLYKLTLQPLLLLPLLLPSSPTPNFLNYTSIFCSILPLLTPFSFVLGNHIPCFFSLKNIYFPFGSSFFFKFLFI